MALCAFSQASRILKPFASTRCFPREGHSPASYLDDAKKVRFKERLRQRKSSSIQIAQFVFEHLWDAEQQILKRSFCGSVSSVDAFADDYAWMVAGLLDLYECSGEIKWLRWAVQLQNKANEIFFDSKTGKRALSENDERCHAFRTGGYFSTAGNDAAILLRLKEEYDSAEPAASSIALSNLIRLSSILASQSEQLMEKATQTIQFFARRMEALPIAMPQLAYSMYLYNRLPKAKKVSSSSSLFVSPQEWPIGCHLWTVGS